MIRKEDDGAWITLRETIAAHHEDVFECLTTASGLTRWFPVAAEIDLRQGGELVLGWTEDFDRKTTVAILDYDPGGRITWDWYASAHNMDLHAPVYWQVMPAREEGAKIVMRQGPFRLETESLLAMGEEAESWRWYLCNLRSVLEARHDMRRVRPL
jgi:uncharacterized protein YndB with AHSA1/START domain